MFLPYKLCECQKKTRQERPCGFVGNVQTLLLAGTTAIRTHAPLARHVFYVFFYVDRLDVQAHCGGDIKDHAQSRANRLPNVKCLRVPGQRNRCRALGRR